MRLELPFPLKLVRGVPMSRGFRFSETSQSAGLPFLHIRTIVLVPA